jgi:RHS repeat-associated protein
LLILETRKGSNVLDRYAYSYDLIGNRTQVIENDGRKVAYNYDALRRLISEKITEAGGNTRSITYTYDAVGNRLTRSDSVDGLTTYTYDSNDRLVTETSSSHVFRYTYDANGNTLTRDDGEGNHSEYTWDFENRLLRIDVTNLAGTHRTENVYDASGLRMRQTVDGQETRYLYDTSSGLAQVALEYRGNGTVITTYVRGVNLISARESGVQSFFHVDGLGSTRLVTDPNGNVTDRFVFDAFGQELSHTGSNSFHYLFAGEQRSGELDYLRARFYNPAVGRFLSADSFEGTVFQPSSLHDYLYANADPVNHVDPTGHFPISFVTTAAMIRLSLVFPALGAVAYAGSRLGFVGLLPIVGQTAEDRRVALRLEYLMLHRMEGMKGGAQDTADLMQFAAVVGFDQEQWNSSAGVSRYLGILSDMLTADYIRSRDPDNFGTIVNRKSYQTGNMLVGQGLWFPTWLRERRPDWVRDHYDPQTDWKLHCSPDDENEHLPGLANGRRDHFLLNTYLTKGVGSLILELVHPERSCNDATVNGFGNDFGYALTHYQIARGSVASWFLSRMAN